MRQGCGLQGENQSGDTERNWCCTGNWVSQSLWSKKPASLNFHPPPTSTSSVSQQAVQVSFHVLHPPPTRAARKSGSKPAQGPRRASGPMKPCTSTTGRRDQITEILIDKNSKSIPFGVKGKIITTLTFAYLHKVCGWIMNKRWKVKD